MSRNLWQDKAKEESNKTNVKKRDLQKERYKCKLNEQFCSLFSVFKLF